MKRLAIMIVSTPLLLFSTFAISSSLDREALMKLDRGIVDRIKNNDIFNQQNNIRERSIRDRAIQMGAQYGYINRINKIQGEFTSNEAYIDNMYNFPYLMSMSSNGSAEMYLIPPIVQEYSDIKALDHERNSLTIIENKYVIRYPARLVTTPLDWRQYLLFTPEAKEMQVASSLLPENDAERLIWANSVDEGWREGVQIAEREMLSRIEKLVEDARGIIRFNRLADDGYFTRPQLVETRIPVTGNNNEVIQNKTIYTIIAESSTNLDDSSWEARVLDNRESMIFPSEYDSVDIRVDTR